MAKVRTQGGRVPQALRVVLGVTGSIAAYKAPLIVRGLVKKGVEVRCVLTPTAAQFVSPLTLTTLSKNPVAQAMSDPALWEMAHLSLASWADLVLIAPRPRTSSRGWRRAALRAYSTPSFFDEGSRRRSPGDGRGDVGAPGDAGEPRAIETYGYRQLGPDQASWQQMVRRLVEPDGCAHPQVNLKGK